MKKKHKKKVKLTLTDKTLSSKEALQKIKAIKDKLQDIKEYKAILTADGMQPDAEDKQRESELIKRLLRLEKQAGIVREKPSWRTSSGGKKSGGKKKTGDKKTGDKKTGDKKKSGDYRSTGAADAKPDSRPASGAKPDSRSKSGAKPDSRGKSGAKPDRRPAPRSAPRPAKK